MNGVEFEFHRGFIWPKDDVECRAVAFDDTGGLAIALHHVKTRGVAVQAGGNCGTWPKLLAPIFETVYTFEPDPINFHCLARNVEEWNVVKIQAGLGEGFEHPRQLRKLAHNCGAHQIDPKHGYLPLIALDNLNLLRCDLLYLDIEGYEIFALKGAADTIRRCKPVIGFEHKGLSNAYGIQSDVVELHMLELGYRKVGAFSNDVIYVPC